VKKSNQSEIGRNNRDTQVIYGGKNKFTIVNFPETGIPDRIRATLSYSDVYALSGTNTALYTYRGNGCFDPRVATGGGQPHYFDQMMGLYQQFFVRRAKIEVQIVNRTNDTLGVCVFANSEATGVTSYYEAIEQENNGVNTLIQPAQGEVKKLVVFETTESALALPASDSTVWGTNAADPANQWYFIVFVENITQAATTTGIFVCKIYYDVEFFDKRYVAPS
jgi:hypothetical protein